MVGVAGVGHGERTQRSELRLDRVGPGGIGRGQAQFDLVPRRPGPDGRGLVRRQVVHDDVDWCAVGSGGADRLERAQGVVAALTAAYHTPELVVAVAVAAVEVADAVGAAVGGRQPIGVALSRPAVAMGWADR